MYILDTNQSMARYSSFLGHRVEVQYRAGDIVLPASGTFVADSGRSIFLEQSLEQRGQQKHCRWEIPYRYIVRLEEVAEVQSVARASVSALSAAPLSSTESSAAVRATAAPSILPLSNRPKTA